MKLITKCDSLEDLFNELCKSDESVIVLAGEAQERVARGIALLFSGWTLNVELYSTLAKPSCIWGHRMLFFDENDETFVGMFAHRIWVSQDRKCPTTQVH